MAVSRGDLEALKLGDPDTSQWDPKVELRLNLIWLRCRSGLRLVSFQPHQLCPSLLLQLHRARIHYILTVACDLLSRSESYCTSLSDFIAVSYHLPQLRGMAAAVCCA